MVVTSLPVPAGAGPTPLANQWGETWLYLRSNNDLSTSPPGASGDPSTFTADTAQRWTMPDGLRKALCIDGGEPSSSATGFDLMMNITTLPGSGDWTLTARLKDEDTTIAEESRVVSPTGGIGGSGTYGTQSDWHLDFSSNRSGCQVLKGHKLQVEVVSSRAAAGGRGSHLVIWAEDVIAPAVATENANGPTDIFYPNDLDGSRSVIVKGALNSAFPSSLVTAVRIGVEAPGGGAVANGTATVQDDNFTYTWSYARGISGGPYTIHVEVEDRQGNIFPATATVTMAAYGLRITAPGQVNQTVTGYTIPGDSATYELTVTNIGAQPTTVLMVTETPAPSGWSISFTSDNFGLAAGGSNVTLFRATPGGTIQPGMSAQSTVVAQARDDPAAVKARGTLLTTTIVQREAALAIDPPSTDATIGLGGYVEYDFTLTNNGGQTADVNLTATDAPEGWVRSLSGNQVVVDGSGWKALALGPGSSRTITLNVTAPTESTSVDKFACTVTARVVGNASTVATFVATTELLLGIELSQTSPNGVPSRAPGETVEFQVEVVNTDPLSAHTITQAGTTAFPSLNNPAPVTGGGEPQVEVFAPSDGTCCAPHSTATISVIVHMPAKALPGRYTFELSTIVDGVSSQVSTLNLSIDINRQTLISLSVDDGVGTLAVGEQPATFELTVSNDGNGLVVLDLHSDVEGRRANEDWTVRFLDQNGGEVSGGRLTLAAYASTIVTVEVSAATSSFHGDERKVHVSASQVGGDATADLGTPIDAAVTLPPVDRFVRLLTAQYIIVFLIGFVLWGLITMSWGRAIWRRTHGGDGGKAAPPEKPPRTAREVK